MQFLAPPPGLERPCGPSVRTLGRKRRRLAAAARRAALGELLKDETSVVKVCKKLDKAGKDNISEHEFVDPLQASDPWALQMLEKKRLEKETIQIHDQILDEEKKDIAKEKQMEANQDLVALQRHTAPDLTEKFAQEANESNQIHDQFLAEWKKDIAEEKQVKANKDVVALREITTPDVSEKVLQEDKENIQTHEQTCEKTEAMETLHAKISDLKAEIWDQKRDINKLREEVNHLTVKSASHEEAVQVNEQNFKAQLDDIHVVLDTKVGETPFEEMKQNLSRPQAELVREIVVGGLQGALTHLDVVLEKRFAALSAEIEALKRSKAKKFFG